MKNTLFIAILLFTYVGTFAQKTLTPVDADSKIHFSIRNFGINTGGDLSGLKGNIKFDPKMVASSMMDVSVQVSTIDTDNEKRDKHLKTDDYFDVEKYPVIRLTSTKIEGTTTRGSFIFHGNLTIKSVTKNISFPFTALADGQGYKLSGNFEINRLDYTIGKESATLSDDVKIELTVSAK